MRLLSHAEATTAGESTFIGKEKSDWSIVCHKLLACQVWQRPATIIETVVNLTWALEFRASSGLEPARGHDCIVPLGPSRHGHCTSKKRSQITDSARHDLHFDRLSLFISFSISFIGQSWLLIMCLFEVYAVQCSERLDDKTAR